METGHSPRVYFRWSHLCGSFDEQPQNPYQKRKSANGPIRGAALTNGGRDVGVGGVPVPGGGLCGG